MRLRKRTKKSLSMKRDDCVQKDFELTIEHIKTPRGLKLYQVAFQIFRSILFKEGSAAEPRLATLLPSICWTIFAKRLWRFWAQESENV